MRGRVLRLRHDRRGVAPVFGELLMVATMSIMAATVYLVYIQMAENAVIVPTAITFRSSGTVPSSVPDICCLNDTILDVSTTLGHPQIWAPSIEYTIESTQIGDMIMQGYLEEEPANLTLIYLGVYHGAPNEPSIVNIWYTDVDQNGVISVSDHVSIRGMSEEFHLAKIRFFYSNREIGAFTIQ